ncbi:MAG: hypothetical protein ACAI38_01460 [Myxococcota bacterium]
MKRAPAFALLFLAGCGDRLFAPCDIRTARCQESLTNGLRQLRNESAIAPSVMVRSEEEVVADSIDSTTPAERESFARQNTILSLLGLSQPGLSLDAQVQNRFDRVAAFYSSSTDAITVIDRGQALDGVGPALTFTHELVHAMQGAEGLLALASQDVDTTDEGLAHRAITEGEATFYEDLAGFDLFGWDDDEHEKALAYYRDSTAYYAVFEDLLIYNASILFPYAFGAAYVRRIWEQGGQPAVVATYDALPSTTFGVIDGEEPSALLGADAIAVPTADYTVAIADRFGAFIVRAWCSRQDFIGCEDIQDDGFTGLVSADGTSSIAIWRMRVRPPNADFLLQRARDAGFNVSLVGDDLIFVASNTGSRVDYTTLVTGWRSNDD